MFGLGTPELLIILAVLLLLFGPKQLPKLFKSVGKSAKALRDGIEGKTEEDEEAPAPKAKKKAEPVEEADEEEEA